jgi:hypothetical protein
VLILKILVAPALIGLASWIGRRWGPEVGGWFAALPLTSGPVVLILALDRGPTFVAQASNGTLLALVSLAAFALAYGWSARAAHWSLSSLIACVAFVACTLALRPVAVPLAWAFVLACVALGAASRLMPASAPPRRRAPRTPSWDIPLRMVLAAVLVGAITTAANTLGPHLSGLLTPFPVAATILAGATHHFEGSAAAGRLLHGLLVGLFSFAVFFLVVGAVVVSWGTTLAFAAATVGALSFHAALWRWGPWAEA